MLQALADRIWADERFHAAAKALERDRLRAELSGELQPPSSDRRLAAKAMQASAVLAASARPEHRQAAYRVATSAYELFQADDLPLDAALRVVLSRLGNFPALGTRPEVEDAYKHLPFSLNLEELSSAAGQSVLAGDNELTLTRFQHELWSRLAGRERVAVSAPTSAGKSFVLQAFLATQFLGGGPRGVVYLVPTRALIAQVAEDLALRFADDGVEQPPQIITVPPEADEELAVRAVYVMTQERAQLCLSNHPDFRADLLVVDEAHGVADGARGVLLQWVIDDLLDRDAQTQVLFASPLIRNPEVFGRLFGLDDLVSIPSAEPTVAQSFLQVDVGAGKAGRITLRSYGDGSRPPEDVAVVEVGHPLGRRSDRLVHIPVRLGLGRSNIVYVDGAAEAEDVARKIAELLDDRVATPRQQALSDLAKEAVHEKYALASCALKGVAFHYSHMPTVVRRAVERAAAEGEVDFLVCTSTLLQGVNLPARNIFMLKPTKGHLKPLVSTDFWNLAGRAGRLGREFQGNIYLIAYDTWSEQPLSGPKDAEVLPAIEKTLTIGRDDLVDVIRDAGGAKRVSDRSDLETTFGRLLSDLKRGSVDVTLRRAGLEPDSAEAAEVRQALVSAQGAIELPPDLIRRTPSFSAHKQQRLFDHLRGRVQAGGEAEARRLIPHLPDDDGAYDSYREILRVGFEHLLGRDTSKGLQNFHAILAIKWMKGLPMHRIIDDQSKQPRNIGGPIATVIRDTLKTIEEEIRFQTVRLFGCYNTLLAYALTVEGHRKLTEELPALPLYLELGASGRTMISFISLGLSRTTAMRLAEKAPRQDFDSQQALDWIQKRGVDGLELSPLLLEEVQNLLGDAVAT